MSKRFGFGVGIAALAAVAIVAIFLHAASGRSDGPPRSGWMDNFVLADSPQAAPSVSFATGDQSDVALSDFEGRVVLINFWATWCAPCVREMPTLDNLEAELGSEDFTVVALSSDREGVAVVAPFYEKLDLGHLDVYVDPRSDVMRAFGVRGLPTTALIDARGREVGRLEGLAEWDSPEALELIRFYLEREE